MNRAWLSSRRFSVRTRTGVVGEPHLGLQVIVAGDQAHLVEVLRQVPLGDELFNRLFRHPDKAFRLEDGEVGSLHFQDNVLNGAHLFVLRGVEPQPAHFVVCLETASCEEGLPGIEGPGVVVLGSDGQVGDGGG